MYLSRRCFGGRLHLINFCRRINNRSKIYRSTYNMHAYCTTAANVGKRIVDFRSDTVTLPSLEMREAMASAVVGDDVYKEDPTVNELESVCAKLFGMEAALFVPSGTMGNLLCVLSHCSRGDELIVGKRQHIFMYEQANYAQFGGISANAVENASDGTIPIEILKAAVRDSSDFHQPRTKLICLENTNNFAGGIPLTAEYMAQVVDYAHKERLLVHVDGARIYNAAVALNTSVEELLRGVDSVSMCFSKGLGCPVGSVIGGTKGFIERALRLRKALGGGMRQAGVLAAAALFSLKHAHRLFDQDHSNAKLLAEGIDKFGSEKLKVDALKVRTNIVLAYTNDDRADEFCEKLAQISENLESAPTVLAMSHRKNVIRFVTHCSMTRDDVLIALDVLQVALNEF